MVTKSGSKGDGGLVEAFKDLRTSLFVERRETERLKGIVGTRDGEIRKLTGQVEDLEAEVAGYRAQLAEAPPKDVAKLQERLRNQAEKIEGLRSELLAAKGRIFGYEKEVKGLEKERDDLRADLFAAQQGGPSAALIEELEARIESYEKREERHEGSERAIKDLTNEVNRLNGDLERYRKRVDDLGQGLKDSKRVIGELGSIEDEQAALHDAIGERDETIAALEARIAEYEAAGGIRPTVEVEEESVFPDLRLEGEDAFVYDLARSLMEHCVETGRYREGDLVGLGMNGSFTYVPWDTRIGFTSLDDVEVIAPSENTSPGEKQRVWAVFQAYRKAVKDYGGIFDMSGIGQSDTVRAPLALLAQLTCMGSGPAKKITRVIESLGFSEELLRKGAEEYDLFDLGKRETSVTQRSIKEAMNLIYPVFMEHRERLYHEVTSWNNIFKRAAFLRYYPEIHESVISPQRCTSSVMTMIRGVIRWVHLIFLRFSQIVFLVSLPLERNRHATLNEAAPVQGRFFR